MSYIFDPYKFDYKQYMLEHYNLTESPARIRDVEYTRNNALLNSASAVQVIEQSTLMGDYQYGSFTFDIYKLEEGDDIFYNLLEKKHPFIYLNHDIEKTELNVMNGVISRDVWNWKSTPGLARLWMFDYILPKHDFIMSDIVHTSKGERFWNSLLKEALSKNLMCGVINMKFKKIIPIDDVDNFEQWYDENKKDYQVIIFK